MRVQWIPKLEKYQIKINGNPEKTVSEKEVKILLWDLLGYEPNLTWLKDRPDISHLFGGKK